MKFKQFEKLVKEINPDYLVIDIKGRIFLMPRGIFVPMDEDGLMIISALNDKG